MKTIPLTVAINLLRNASAIIIDDDALIYACVSEYCGEDDNEFMYLQWENEGTEYYVKFEEGNNKEVKIDDDGDMILEDFEGNPCRISILVKHDCLLNVE